MLDPDALCVAILDGDEIAGLVNRQDFLLRYTYQFGPDLYGRRDIAYLMDRAPLIVDEAMPHPDVGARLIGGASTGFLRGYVVTRKGRYFGVGTALSLLRLALAQSEGRLEEVEYERQRAEEANRSKTNFLASMSHELRTPLNAIIGFTDFIASEPFGPVQPQRYGEYVSDVNASANHLLGLINDLLDMAKIESGHMELHETVFPADQPIREVHKMLRQSFENAGIRLVVDLPETSIYLRADERMCRQVLLNLMSNALKFTPIGGTVTVSARNENGEIRVDVEDTGIGIPKDRLASVLEPFEQVEGAMNRSRPGTGLGLPLARAMAEAHGGRLILESELGKGTRVTVFGPADRVLAAPPEEALTSAA